jgi:hypothetical protein
MTPLQEAVLAIAETDCVTKPVREVGRNSGPKIDTWLQFVNCQPGAPYCAAAVSYWVVCGHGGLAVIPRFRRSASALGLLSKNPGLSVGMFDAREALQRGEPLVFVQDHGGGKGHTGIAYGMAGVRILTYEANTGPGPEVPAKDRDGQGCYPRSDRKFSDVNGGWLQIS